MPDRDLLDHAAGWIQVFESAVNDSPPAFDPAAHGVTEHWADRFTESSRAIVTGLREKGFQRPMTMRGNPLPGQLVMNMLLMEYVAHGWDLARAVGQDIPYSDEEGTVALSATQAITTDEYRGTGMFDQPVAPRTTQRLWTILSGSSAGTRAGRRRGSTRIDTGEPDPPRQSPIGRPTRAEVEWITLKPLETRRVMVHS